MILLSTTEHILVLLTFNLTPWTTSLCNWSTFRGHKYLYIGNGQIFPDANATCAALDSHMVTISSDDELQFLKSLAGNSDFLIGARENEESSGSFYWLTGEPVTWVHWHDGEPNNPVYNCVQIWNDNGVALMDDGMCDYPIPFICETYDSAPLETIHESWSCFRGNKYKYVESRLSWHDASNACSFLGSHLVTISSSEELDYIGTLTGMTRVWIGGREDVYGPGLQWQTREPITWEQWHANEPNNEAYDCIWIYASDGHFLLDDNGCDFEEPFVCELNRDSNIYSLTGVPINQRISTSYVFSTITDVSILRCAVKCRSNRRQLNNYCRGFNYKNESNKVGQCELTSTNAVAAPHVLTTTTGYRHYYIMGDQC